MANAAAMTASRMTIGGDVTGGRNEMTRQRKRARTTSIEKPMPKTRTTSIIRLSAKAHCDSGRGSDGSAD
eukprot:6175173-Pleurochrysis_carterae.AAC.5